MKMRVGAPFTALVFFVVRCGVLGTGNPATCCETGGWPPAEQKEHTGADCVSAAAEAVPETGAAELQPQAYILEWLDRITDMSRSMFWTVQSADLCSCSVKRDLQCVQGKEEKVNKLSSFLKNFNVNCSGVLEKEVEHFLGARWGDGKLSAACSDDIQLLKLLSLFLIRIASLEAPFHRLLHLCQEITTQRIWHDLESRPEETEQHIQSVIDDTWFSLTNKGNDLAWIAKEVTEQHSDGTDTGTQLKALQFGLGHGALLVNFLKIAFELMKIIIEWQGQETGEENAASVYSHMLRCLNVIQEGIFGMHSGAFRNLLMAHVDTEAEREDPDVGRLKGLFAMTDRFIVTGKTLVEDCVDAFNEIVDDLQIGTDGNVQRLANLANLERSKMGRIRKFVHTYEETKKVVEQMEPGVDTSGVRKRMQELKQEYERAFDKEIVEFDGRCYTEAYHAVADSVKHLLRGGHSTPGEEQALGSVLMVQQPRFFEWDEYCGYGLGNEQPMPCR